MGLLSHSEKKTQSKTVTPDLIFKSSALIGDRLGNKMHDSVFGMLRGINRKHFHGTTGELLLKIDTFHAFVDAFGRKASGADIEKGSGVIHRKVGPIHQDEEMGR